MRNENIKLHSNIMKIFKYLVFIIALFTLFLFVQSNRCLAFDYLGYDSNKISSSSSDYRVDVAYRAPYWWVTTNIEITFCEIGNSSSCMTFTKENPPSVKAETIYRFYNNGEYDYLNNVSWGSATYSSKQKNSPIKGFYSFKQGLEVSVKAEVYTPFKTENRYFSKKIYDWGVPHSFTYNGNLTDSTICVYNGSYCIETAIKQTDWAKSHNVTITYSGAKEAKYCIGSMHPNAGYDCGGNRNGWKEFTSNEKITVGTTGYVYLKFDSKTFYVEKYEKAISFRVDTTAPSITVPTSDDASTWAKSHTVSGITFKDWHSGVNTSTKYYCWRENSTTPGSTDSCWTSFTGDSVTKSSLTGKYYLHVKASDNAGNVGYGKTSSAMYFDNEAPTITNLIVDSSDWAKSHTVSGMTFDDNNRSGVNDSTKKYCWNTSSSNSGCKWTSFTGSSVTGSNMTGEYYLHVQVSDNAGNIGYARTSSALKFDNTAPTVTIKSVSNSGYWAKNHTASIVIVDNHSGNNTLYYCWSTSTVTCTGTTSSMSISGKNDTKSISGDTSMNGTYLLRVWAIDNVRNTSTAIVSEVIAFDNTSPIIALPTIQEWRKSHTVNFKVTDDYSGVSAVKYCINQIETMAYSSSNSCWKPVTLSSGNGSLTFDGATLKYNGIYYLHIYAADSVVETTKNTSKKAMTLRFDNTPPVIESLVRDSSDWKQKHSFNFKIKDEHSGISVIKYCLSKSTSMPTLSNACWKVYDISREANKKEISGGKQLEEKVNDIHYLYLYVEDSVAETVKNSSSKRIELKYDNEKPVIENIQVDTQNWERKHKVTASISDGPSGISEVRSTWCTSSVRSNCGDVSSWKLHTSTVNGTYSFEENTNTKTGPYYLHIYVADKTADIKNETYAVTAYMLFDNIAPKVSLSVDSDKWEHSHVVTINSSDRGSGVVNHTYTIYKYNESKKEYEKFENSKTTMSNTIEIGCLVADKTTCADKSEKYTGKFRVDVYATDGVALLSEIKQIEILLDNSRPKVKITSITSENAWAKAHTVTLEIEDAQSGLNELVYKWCKASGECTKEEKISFNGETKVVRVVEGKDIDGEYYLSIIVTDKVETSRNTLELVTKALKFDNTAPILLDINNKELKNIVNNKLLVKASDVHTSVGKVQISWGTEIKNVEMSKDANGNYVYEFPKEVEGTIKVTLTLIDILGNKDIKEYEIEVDTVSIIAKDKDDNKLVTVPNLSIRRPSRVENKVNYEIEEMVDIEVEEDKAIVVVSEEVENIEVSVNEEEYKKLDNKVIELANSEVCVISIKFSYANEELKKLFVLNKKLNKWNINKR